MDELRAELAAKSCEIHIGGQKHSLFYSWELYDQAKKNGITIDAHALADPQRVIGEITKMIYACILCHRSVAEKVGTPISKEAPTLQSVEAFMLLDINEGKKAIEYIRCEMTVQVEEQREQKKRLNENSTS